MTTDAPADPAQLVDLATRAAQAFRAVQDRVFGDDPAVNPRLAVEVVEVVLVDQVPTLVLITPWTVNGLLFPPADGPAELELAGGVRRAFRGDVAPLGVYWSVNLVPDVSGLTSPKSARTLAESFAGPFRDAVRGWLEAGGA